MDARNVVIFRPIQCRSQVDQRLLFMRAVVQDPDICVPGQKMPSVPLQWISRCDVHDNQQL